MATTWEIIKLSFGDPVSVAVLLVLGALSLGTWGTILYKYFALSASGKENRRFFAKFNRVQDFAQVGDVVRSSPDCALKSIASDVLDESAKFSPYVHYDSIGPRAQLLEDAIQRSIEATRLQEDSYQSFLAVTSNVSPFFGLFGTVWGIMQSFYQIGMHGSADLSVVAPGIAVALITTVAGLIAAIPASIAYNALTNRNNRAEIGYYNFGSHLLSLFKRGDLITLERQDEAELGGKR
jgi:biopolymer transport protein TolQ